LTFDKMVTRIGEIIPGVIEKIVKGKPIKAREGSGYGGLVDTWNSLVGKEIAAHTRIKGFKKKVLYVLVDSSPHLSHLLMEKETILRRLEEIIPEVREIKFKAR